ALLITIFRPDFVQFSQRNTAVIICIRALKGRHKRNTNATQRLARKAVRKMRKKQKQRIAVENSSKQQNRQDIQ
nr:hypothetical protein [Alloscardovia omnicolens]